MPCGDPRRWAQRGAAGHIGVPAAQRSGQARAKRQSVKALRLHVRDPTQSRGPHEHPGGTAGRCAHTSSCAAGAWPLSRQQQHLSNPPRLRFLSGPPLCGHHWVGGSPPNLEGSRTRNAARCSLLGPGGRGGAGRGAGLTCSGSGWSCRAPAARRLRAARASAGCSPPAGAWGDTGWLDRRARCPWQPQAAAAGLRGHRPATLHRRQGERG